MLKIWGRTNSVNVQKALAALEEAGIAYERVDAGLAYGVVNSPEYRALNPNASCRPSTMTALFCGSRIPSSATSAPKYAPHLWPADPQTRAAAERWMDWQLTTLLDP